MPPNRTRLINRTCGAAALIWLLIASQLNGLWPFPANDFAQFYMGAAIARAGKWEALYPVPSEGSRHNPGLAGDSEMKPAYAALATAIGVQNAPRFIQAPPVAVMLAPMALLPYRAAMRLWMLLMGLAAWGVALCSARILSLALGRRSVWEGALSLGIAVCPRTLAAVRLGNVSALEGLLVGLLACQILARQSIRGAAALVVGTVAKYASIVFLLLALAARRWRMLAWSAGIGIALLTASLAAAGGAPFLAYLREILPTLPRTFVDPFNQSIWSVIPRWIGTTSMPPALAIALAGLQVLLLAWVTLRLFQRPHSDWSLPVPVFAAAAALTSWFLIFSPVVWNSYQLYLMPFWGWLLAEGLRSRVRGALAGAVIAAGWIPWPTISARWIGWAVSGPVSSMGLLSAAGVFCLALSSLGLTDHRERGRRIPASMSARRSLGGSLSP